MTQARIPTGFWLEGRLRDLNARGGAYYVLQRGDSQSGVILMKISDCAGICRLLIQERNLEGILAWADALGEEKVEESRADAYIARARSRDPDLWVVEVEDRGLQNPFAE
ncbi:MAG: DUF1491 family protein [Alphaproteobacteria bacterium]|nr:DUF1491 family protein [Alphaproteobacteria bacterium]